MTHHAVLNYKIYRKDGSIGAGQTPYRGNSLSQDALVEHIKGFFSGPPRSYNNIEVSVATEYDNGDDWIKEVYLMESFGHLQRVTNYAGDLIKKHNLPRQDKR